MEAHGVGLPNRRVRTQDKLLELLKKVGPLTAQELAGRLQVSTVAARKHLEALEADGLVEVQVRRQPVGRPAHVYRLTAGAEGHFPQAYQQLALDLLSELCTLEGEEQVARLLSARRARLEREYGARLVGKELDGKVRELARLREEAGYIVTLEKTGGDYVLHQHHCPICEVARRYRQTCRDERDLYQALLGTPVERRQCRGEGDPGCSYHIEGQEGTAGAG